MQLLLMIELALASVRGEGRYPQHRAEIAAQAMSLRWHRLSDRRGASLQFASSCFTLQCRLADSPNLQVRHFGEGAL